MLRKAKFSIKWLIYCSILLSTTGIVVWLVLAHPYQPSRQQRIDIFKLNTPPPPVGFPLQSLFVNGAVLGRGKRFLGSEVPTVSSWHVNFTTVIPYEEVIRETSIQLESVGLVRDKQIRNLGKKDPSDKLELIYTSYSDNVNWVIALTYWDNEHLDDQNTMEVIHGSDVKGYMFEIIDLRK